MKTSRPSLFLATAVVVLLIAGWGYVRVFLFDDTILPLTFVLPILLCVWTRRLWHVWLMAVSFVLMALAKVFWVMPEDVVSTRGALLYLGSTLINILVGAVVVHAIVVLRTHLEQRNAMISAQNAELDAQTEEVLQQNEEIKAQAEELAEQNEEIEAQSEEVTRQNEDLVDLNTRLSGREEILEGLIKSFRQNHSTAEMLAELCKRALSIIGAPATSVGILEQNGGQMELASQALAAGEPSLPRAWPLSNSIASVVLRENRTAYVSDLSQRPDLSEPFGNDRTVHSMLATPLSHKRGPAGLLVACSPEVAHWTEEQFRVIEWIAAQGALMIETLRSQQSLEEHAAALEAANQAKDRFLAMLSHELRTPLTPVLAAAGVLEKDPRIPADVREDIAMIRRNAGIQSRLIDDLLDLTRVSRGKIELDRQLHAADDLLRDAVQIIDGDIDAKSQHLQLEIDEIEGCGVVGDGPRLQQVFWNLLKNAAKFSPPGATIRLHAQIQDQRLVVKVHDEGLGIASEDLERIFLPFEQTHSKPRQGTEGGLGLGLAIAKAIIEIHDGTIEVQSRGHSHGSTFVVTLPASELPDAPASSPCASPVHSPVNGDAPPHILLVEDHGDTGKILKRLLQSAGYTVEHAETAAEGYRLFQEMNFDLVVSDVGLPDESGIELMKRMRSLQADIRGICLSGYGMEDDIDACHEAGFGEHLTKPVDFGRLQSAIAKILA